MTSTPPSPSVKPLTPSYSHFDQTMIGFVMAKIGGMLDVYLASLTGKDTGWFVEEEADGSVMVERRFTEKRGMTYAPLVWAFKVSPDESGLMVTPANHAAEIILAGSSAWVDG
ncbi:MAG: hypothetical protein M3O41_00445 [Pseudomonadota bacterium]|nr:hypothetical protein [Pseudomonadota bacterium]